MFWLDIIRPKQEVGIKLSARYNKVSVIIGNMVFSLASLICLAGAASTITRFEDIPFKNTESKYVEADVSVDNQEFAEMNNELDNIAKTVESQYRDPSDVFINPEFSFYTEYGQRENFKSILPGSFVHSITAEELAAFLKKYEDNNAQQTPPVQNTTKQFSDLLLLRDVSPSLSSRPDEYLTTSWCDVPFIGRFFSLCGMCD
jgi:hypothetical protein